jgi:RHS repeat-associated protein
VTVPDGTWVEYQYDGLERMVSRTDNTGEVVLFFHEGLNDQIALETDAAGTVDTRYLVDSFGVARGKLDIGNSIGRSYYITDPRANVTQMIGASDQAVKAVFAYDPYGKDKAALSKKLTANWDSRLKFQMAPKDPKTGAYNIGSRLMNPTINRFVGSDNYVASGANLGLQADPLTGNRYLYAGANRAGLIDDGHGSAVCTSSIAVACKTEEKDKKEAKERRKIIPPIPYIYVTYTKTNERTGLVYSGRTSGFGTPAQVLAARDSRHTALDQQGYGPAFLDEVAVSTGLPRDIDPAYWAIRGREQQLIDYHGKAWTDTGGKDDPNKRFSGNKIRAVSKWNLAGRLYHEQANAYFDEELYVYTGYL